MRANDQLSLYGADFTNKLRVLLFTSRETLTHPAARRDLVSEASDDGYLALPS